MSEQLKEYEGLPKTWDEMVRDREKDPVAHYARFARARLAELGVRDLSPGEFVQLRRIVKECLAQRTRLRQDEKENKNRPYHGFGIYYFDVDREAMARWLLEETGIFLYEIPKVWVVTDPVTLEQNRFEPYQYDKMTEKIEELRKRYRRKYNSRQWTEIVLGWNHSVVRAMSRKVAPGWAEIIRRIREEKNLI